MDEADFWSQIESLYRARFPQFERVARAITGDPESALEAVQETSPTRSARQLSGPKRLIVLLRSRE